MSDDKKPTARTEVPAPTADAAAAGEPTVVESRPARSDDAAVSAHADETPDPGPAHRADVTDAAAGPEKAAAVDTTVVAPLLPPVSTARAAETHPGAKSETRPAAADSAPSDRTPPGPAAERETGGLREPRAEERGQSPHRAPAVAAAPVPVPTAPVAATGEAPVAAPTPARTVYLEAPLPPKRKGNRGFGVLMAVLATLVYALIWAGVAAAVIALSSAADRFGSSVGNFLVSPAFWAPVLVFALGMILLSLLINRGGWAWWLIGGFVLAALVYLGYLGGALLTVANEITAADANAFVTRVALTPLAIASAVVAREVSIWFGLANSARGRRVKARNAEARAAFDKESAERRVENDRARAGYAEPAQ